MYRQEKSNVTLAPRASAPTPKGVLVNISVTVYRRTMGVKLCYLRDDVLHLIIFPFRERSNIISRPERGGGFSRCVIKA